MSAWTHAVCWRDWYALKPDRTPVRIRDAVKTVCCFCGEETKSGIYVRKAPEEVACKGGHGDDD